MPNNFDESWILISPESRNPDFVTHLNYVECLRDCSSGLSIASSFASLPQIGESRVLGKKVKLIELTYQNLQEEWKNIYRFSDYSVICVSWIPVKSYYLVFNFLILLEYLLDGSERWLTETHNKILQKFSNMVKDGTVSFSDTDFNTTFRPRDILSWRIPVGQNLAMSSPDLETRKKQILRILLRYQTEEHKRMRGIRRLAGQKRTDFLNSTEIGFFDFFYLYRIKANYRDMEFIDTNVPVSSFYNFYKGYFELTLNFYQAFKGLINDLSVQRLGREIIT